MTAYFYVYLTVVFTVCCQLIIKWRMGGAGPLPESLSGKVSFIMVQFLDPWVLSGIFCAFLAALAWMAAMTKLDLSHAYPFTSLSFVLVLVTSHLLFGEPITLVKVVGLALIIAGIVVGSQG
jgi:multidrug transporter EmrE-like cation transporter